MNDTPESDAFKTALLQEMHGHYADVDAAAARTQALQAAYSLGFDDALETALVAFRAYGGSEIPEHVYAIVRTLRRTP